MKFNKLSFVLTQHEPFAQSFDQIENYSQLFCFLFVFNHKTISFTIIYFILSNPYPPKVDLKLFLKIFF